MSTGSLLTPTACSDCVSVRRFCAMNTRRGGTARPRPASARRENGLSSYPRCARRRGEYGCDWPTHARRTDAPVVVWDLRGSHVRNSPRGIASPVFRSSTALSSVEARLRGARLAPRSAVGQHRHGVAASRFIPLRVHRFAGWTVPVTSLTGFALRPRSSIPW